MNTRLEDFVVGLVAGLVTGVGLLAAVLDNFEAPERRIVEAANECYEKGMRAAYYDDQVHCR